MPDELPQGDQVADRSDPQMKCLDLLFVSTLVLLVGCVARGDQGGPMPVASQGPSQGPVSEPDRSVYAVMDSISFTCAGSAYDAVILHSMEEDSIPEPYTSNAARPLLLYKVTAEGKRSLIVRNDDLVMCEDCGGIYGDPYAGISFDQDTLKLEHYGGSNWRWAVTHAFVVGVDDAWPLAYKHTVSYWIFEQDSTLEETRFMPTAKERLATCTSVTD
jgi:hypothetical protein